MTEPRDIAYEADLTRVSAHARGLPPEAADVLTRFAQSRAGADPVRDIDTRDFELELREELADARNYAVWRIAQLQRRHDGEAYHDLDRARRLLEAVTVAYYELVREVD